MDYKDTLNLPNTPFPMKASLSDREPPRLARWQAEGLYEKIRQKGLKAQGSYVLHDGPPYANAPIHLGTALNKILKDVVVKSKTLSGYDAPYIPGWDCHGLPIELHVEKKVGKAGDKLNAREFRQACRDFAGSQVEIQKADFKRLGVVGDWDHPYLSMDPQYEANEVRALAEIVKQGHLERGQKPVHWCTACGSALAEAEVEYQDKVSPAIDVAFDVVDVADMLARFGTTHAVSRLSVPIWTTTPWTLPANQAVAMNPTIDYALVAYPIGEDRYDMVIAESLVPTVMARYGVDYYKKVATAPGAVFEGLLLQHPFLNRHVPIILGDHVTIDAGTGNVHTAPAHGIDDYKVGQKYQLTQECPVNAKSCFVEGTPLVSGLHVFKANQPIVDALRASKHLLHLAELSHSYPHCWRHKTPLIFRATPQWFVSMEKKELRQFALDAVGQTEWLPSWGENRIRAMIESRPDWCISRQRSWGVPITLFIHKDTSAFHPNTLALMEQVAQRIEKDSIDAWYDLDPKELLGDDADQYVKVTDTLDVWFDSGVSHYCVLQKRLNTSVADLYLEGSDQHRGWFQTSLLTSVAMQDKAPFKTVLTHGYVVDGKGYKMSKSVGNTIAPQDIINKYGADVLRLWAVSADYTGDVKVSDDIFKQCSDAYRRIRNTARFLLSNLNDFNLESDVIAPSDMAMLDRYMVSITMDKQRYVQSLYDAFNFQEIYQAILNFCTNDLGSFYLDIIKDRLYTAKANSQARRSAQTAMFHILEAMVRWLAPIISFTADEIWEYMPGQREPGALFYNTWYEFSGYDDSYETIQWESVKLMRNEVNKLLEKQRQAGHIGSSLDVEIVLYTQAYEELFSLGEELRFALITSGARVERFEDAPWDAESTAIEGLKIQVIKSPCAKCERCWQHREDVGSDRDHPSICGRCVMNVSGEGERREFA